MLKSHIPRETPLELHDSKSAFAANRSVEKLLFFLFFKNNVDCQPVGISADVKHVWFYRAKARLLFQKRLTLSCFQVNYQVLS